MASTTLHISIIQTTLEWESKTQNLEKFEKLFRSVNPATHIIVLPEMFSTGFSMNAAALAEEMDGNTVLWMKKQSQLHKKIITGSLIIKENDHFYNRLIWMQPDGRSYHYDKAHLFGKAQEDQHYTAGTKKLIVQVNGWKILLQTCYDLRFPVWARQEKELYDVLINVANWPEARSEAWKALLKARAIENQAYVVACNVFGKDGHDIRYSGDSVCLDYNGHVLWTATYEERIGYISLNKEKLDQFRSDFPFLNDRDSFLLLNG